jgi:phosphoribosylamine--glycine ligase
MKVLVIGSGGREHAICWKLKQSKNLTALYCAPGNGGIAQVATCVPITSHQEIVAFCLKEEIEFVMIGPEGPLVEGLADALREQDILVFGPSKEAAQLEGSKGFMKDLCRKYNIPTAEYMRFTDPVLAQAYIHQKGAPIVIKADGLAAGKGVVVAMEMREALAAVDFIFDGKFGSAGKSIVVEEYLEGEEVSFFALCDGKYAIAFGAAQDHKRVGDGDTGPNTGGMGTYSPVPIFTEALQKSVMQTIIKPTVNAMREEGVPFQGVLFAGLMLTAKGPKLLEYNVRFGDPETQVLMKRLKSDFLSVLIACAKGHLEHVPIEFIPDAAVCVVMAAQGYPETYVKNTVIRNLEEASALRNVQVFHAGTILKDNQYLAVGGRVLGVTACGTTASDAQKKAYKAVDTIDWPEGFCRRDIGKRAIGKKVS